MIRLSVSILLVGHQRHKMEDRVVLVVRDLGDNFGTSGDEIR